MARIPGQDAAQATPRARIGQLAGHAHGGGGLVAGSGRFQVWDIFHTCAGLITLASLHPPPRLLREVRPDLQVHEDRAWSQ